MNQTIPLLTLQIDPENGLLYVQEALAAAGMEVQRSFDFQVARAAHAGCTCPHHGTERCTCQLVVLLVYGESPAPATLVVHGREGITNFALVDIPASRPDGALAATIREALTKRAYPPRAGWEWSHAT